MSHCPFHLLSQARGEPYRPSSSLSAPVTRFDGRPRARDRPKPRRRPRPKEPEEPRRSRSAPATGAPTTPQPPSHTAHNEGFLYRKKATTSDLEVQQRSPNRYKHHLQNMQQEQFTSAKIAIFCPALSPKSAKEKHVVKYIFFHNFSKKSSAFKFYFICHFAPPVSPG